MAHTSEELRSETKDLRSRQSSRRSLGAFALGVGITLGIMGGAMFVDSTSHDNQTVGEVGAVLEGAATIGVITGSRFLGEAGELGGQADVLTGELLRRNELVTDLLDPHSLMAQAAAKAEQETQAQSGQ